MEEPSSRISAKETTIVAVSVFAIAFFLRLPSCYESLWLDELHSAWVVWGDLSDVYPRSTAGHQSAFYFYGLWFWKQLVGESEVALRLASVLAVAMACAVLVVGVARWSRSTLAGITAGLILAIERNSLFFGTELRPYAFVILFASIAVILFLHLSKSQSRHVSPRSWSVMIVAILLATLCQPTAIGVLAFLPAILGCVWFFRDRKQLFRPTILDGILGFASVAIGLTLWRGTLSDSWQQRDNWASFARASKVEQLWQTWDWMYLVIIPIAIAVLAWASRRKPQPGTTVAIGTTLLLAIIAIAATSLFWLVSRSDLVPIWHRRFFIAVLPILACVGAASIGTVHQRVRSHRAVSDRAVSDCTVSERTVSEYWGVALCTGVAALLISLLAVHQGKVTQLRTHSVALVSRGEDWRGAVEFVRSEMKVGDKVYLDAALIESRQIVLFTSGAENQIADERYLAFPLMGPYTTANDSVDDYSVTMMPGGWSMVDDATRGTYLITRRQSGQVKNLQTRGSRVIGFGGVSVLFLPRVHDRDNRG